MPSRLLLGKDASPKRYPRQEICTENERGEERGLEQLNSFNRFYKSGVEQEQQVPYYSLAQRAVAAPDLNTVSQAIDARDLPVVSSHLYTTNDRT